MKNITSIIIFCLSIMTSLAQEKINKKNHAENTDVKIVIPKDEPIKDIDGNIYHTVVIGSQTWMKENLRTTHYRNGESILTTTPATLDVSSEEKISSLVAKDLSTPAPSASNVSEERLPKYQWPYAGDEENVAVYGRLYTWYAVTDERNVCPEGWHIPTDREWTILIDYLGGNVVAGGKLKEENSSCWAEPNVGATNESGFKALPAGGRNVDGSFSNIGKYSAWWTSSPGIYRHIEHDTPYTFRNYYYNSKVYGFSIRCIKD
jgi:uncharacterized protein (TIGR02145 family)